MIHIDDDAKCFHLRAKDSSYVINCFDGRYLLHGYWGEALSSPNPGQMSTLGASPYLITEPLDEASLERYKRNWIQEGKNENRSCPSESSSIFSPEKLTLEYPIAGMGDLRAPALRVRLANGSASGFLSYQGYARLGGCPGPDGLPYISHAPFDCETLRIDLKDEFSGIRVSLFYLPLQDLPIVLRWVRLINRSGKTVEIEAIASVSLDLPGFDGDMVSLNGSWGRERHFHRRPVSPGVQMVESRGASSSHQHAPFLGLADREATERWGRIRGLSLIYSGNHRHLVERSQYGTLRLQCGINPDGFSFRLPPGEHFDAPAAVLVWSCQGFSGLSEAFHGFTRTCLLPAQWRNTDRPIVINTWEAHYFDVNIDKAAALAREGKKIGAEVLVLDDGWFVNRRDDKRALGDWAPDSGKFPGGLREAARRINDLGMKFGIWMEPEMVSPDSDLYRRHPDWILSAPGRSPSLARNQLVLDMGKDEVVGYLLDTIEGILSSAPIAYVKWDMNRCAAETNSPEAMHRHILGVYRLWGSLVKDFPEILFEGCAGGGGRFDFGSLAYMPQFWTSDQTDAVERQAIQFGSSLLFPPETMGAHVSAVPNHQVGRVTPPETRALAALCFNYGYELNLHEESEADRAVFARYSAIYKRYRRLFRTGKFERLLPEQESFTHSLGSGVEHKAYAWAVVSPDRSLALVFYFQTLAESNGGGRWLRVHGLDPGRAYRDAERDVVFEAAFLAGRGLWIPPVPKDYRGLFWILEDLGRVGPSH